MNLREIISISGKPGLYRVINGTKMPFTVEEVGATKRFPVFARDNISSLGDISMYTEEGDTPLGEVFESISKAYSDALPVEKEVAASHQSLRAFMEKVLPTYDEERVHDSDIKKLIKWYLILRNAGMDTFVEKEAEETTETSEEKED